jgi:NADPH:quinone reductase-like Zn-dependent oxidoreductase
MRAILYNVYGPPEVLHLKDIPTPKPCDHEVLIKIVATTVTSADCRVRSLTVPRGFKLFIRLFFGWSKPRQKILGTEFSGVIVEVGKNVKAFKLGDQVFGFSDKTMGCYVEYKCFSENGLLAPKPYKLSLPQSVALSFGGTTALDFLKRGHIKPGEEILIHGASGSVGTASIQLAKHFGANVTGVCSTGNIELLKELGVDHVIDYSKIDFTKNGKAYDIILDTVGTVTFAKAKNSLKDGGRLLAVAADLPEMLKIPLVSLFSNKKVIAGPAVASTNDLKFLASLVDSDKYRPVIDRFFSIEQIVEAHSYVDRGHKRGNVIVSIASES